MSTGNPGPHLPQNTAELPAAVRKLQSQPGFCHKVSSCKKVVITKIVVIHKPSSKNNDVVAEEFSNNNSFRLLGETEGIRRLVTEAVLCSHCKKGKLTVSFHSIGTATEICTKCDHCQQWCSSSGVQGTQMSGGSKRIARNTDQSANCLFVLAMLLCGDGGMEAKHITELLDLPTSASIDKSNFLAIKYDLAIKIIQYTKELLKTNLLDEVWQWAEDNEEFDMEEWMQAWKNSHPFPLQSMPALIVSYDMGWQKRSSGNRYDSHSGHVAAIGCKTRKPIALAVLSKFCRICANGED
jgi:hypothetical protein